MIGSLRMGDTSNERIQRVYSSDRSSVRNTSNEMIQHPSREEGTWGNVQPCDTCLREWDIILRGKYDRWSNVVGMGSHVWVVQSRMTCRRRLTSDWRGPWWGLPVRIRPPRGYLICNPWNYSVRGQLNKNMPHDIRVSGDDMCDKHATWRWACQRWRFTKY